MSGVITFQGVPAAGARVTIAGQEQTTDATGSFAFAEVPTGPQVLEAHLDVTDQAFVVQRRALVVDGATSQDVTLPEPVAVSVTSATPEQVQLQWTPFQGDGFREYKIYWSGTPGLDETTGVLALVVTDPSRTSATLTLMNEDRGYTRYYRVFVMDEIGKLAGSNVLPVPMPRWDSSVTRRYELRQADAKALAGDVSGITWDGQHLWAAYGTGGPYWDPKPVRLVEHDLATLAELRSFTYSDEYALPSGLAWTGSSVWLAYTANDVRKLESIDPQTGVVIDTLSTANETTDLGFDGTHLLVGFETAVQRINPATGAIGPGFELPDDFDRYGGIAHRAGEIWVASMWGSDILILDETGRHVFVAANPLPSERGWTYLAFIGDRLAMAFGSQLFLYDIVTLPTQ